jgi:hypothetical protein
MFSFDVPPIFVNALFKCFVFRRIRFSKSHPTPEFRWRETANTQREGNGQAKKQSRCQRPKRPLNCSAALLS